MIEGLILDIDGVLVGQTPGKTFPLPHHDVLAALRVVLGKVKFVSFCTAKPLFAISKLIDVSGMRSIHIASGGAEILSPTGEGKVMAMPREESLRLIDMLDKEQIFTEVYTSTDYFIRMAPSFGVEKMHENILGRMPKIVRGLRDIVAKGEITKIMPVAYGEGDKLRIAQLLKPFESSLSCAWTVHPAAYPYQFCVMTAQGVSKGAGTLVISKQYGVTLDAILAVGDSTSDWEFIQLCGYKAAMGNASDELKERIINTSLQSFVGTNVEQNGILDIFKHFTLIE